MGGSNAMKQMSLVIPLGNKEYAIDYAISRDKFSNYLKQAQTIMDTFQLINKQ